MAALPSYVKLLRDDAGEEFDPGVVVSEMEKGLPKMRVGQSRVAVSVSATLLFETRQASLDFEDWYFNTIKRIGWFDWQGVSEFLCKRVGLQLTEMRSPN